MNVSTFFFYLFIYFYFLFFFKLQTQYLQYNMKHHLHWLQMLIYITLLTVTNKYTNYSIQLY